MVGFKYDKQGSFSSGAPCMHIDEYLKHQEVPDRGEMALIDPELEELQENCRLIRR